MSVKLRDYQKEAIKKMKNGCILNGDVGSGKSLTALAYYIYCNGGNIDDLYEPMDGLAVQDLYIITTARKRDTFEWDKELGICLLSRTDNIYSSKVVVDSWNNIKKYTEVKDAFFIFDEQRVVGYGAWTKSFLKITKSNSWILLSATPGDSWSDYIPVFIANGFYKNKSEFIREHVIYRPFTTFPQIDRYTNTGRLMRLRDRILVDMSFKHETIQHHEDYICNYDISAYKTLIKDRWNIFENKPIESPPEFCYLLRKVCNSDITRLEAVKKLLKEHPKAIIFYNFDYELELLRGVLEGENIPYAEWNGHKHQDIPEGQNWAYLVQYNASEGWNCVRTDTMIFYSQNYSYKTMIQAAGRINRLNTPFTDLYYYHLKSHSSIDISISRALKSKKKFNETKFYNWTA